MSDAIEADSLRIVDSLAPAAMLEPLEPFLSELTLSIIAIRPREDASPSRKPHAEGLAEMTRVRDRMARRGIKR